MVAVGTSRLSCRKVEKTRIFTLDWESSWESRLRSRPPAPVDQSEQRLPREKFSHDAVHRSRHQPPTLSAVPGRKPAVRLGRDLVLDRKSTRLNSSHLG